MKTLITCLIFIFGPVAFALDTYGTAGDQVNSPIQKFDIDDLKKLISSQNITSIEELLPKLPSQYLQNYNLIYNSRSLQGASFTNPRVLMFGSNASLIMTFNGSEDQNNFNNLELMQFDKEKRTFNFQDIEFELGKAPKFSKKNPESCLKCHGQDPKPIWDNYPFWPGVYGSSEDRLNLAEGSHFYRYNENKKQHPRYKHLIDLERNAFNNLKLTDLLGRMNLSRVSKKFTSKEVFYPFRYLFIAATLNCFEIDENGKNISYLKKAMPDSLAPVFGDSLKFKSEFMDSMIKVRKKTYERAASYLNTTVKNMLQNDQRLSYEMDKLTKTNPSEHFNAGYYGIYAALNYIDVYNVADRDSWSMAGFPSKTIDTHYGYFGFNSLPIYLAKDWLDPQQDAQIYSYFLAAFEAEQKMTLQSELSYLLSKNDSFMRSTVSSLKKKTCQVLADKNKLTVENLPANYFDSVKLKLQQQQGEEILNPNSSVKRVFKTCQGCHTNTVEGVRMIPFDDEAKLIEELKSPSYIEGSLAKAIRLRLDSKGQDHMPKFGHINDSEKQTILNYLNQHAEDANKK